MKNLSAIKPSDEDYCLKYRRRKNKFLMFDESDYLPLIKSQNLSESHKIISKIPKLNINSIDYPAVYIHNSYLRDKKSKKKLKYFHKQYLLSIKYLKFLSQENLTEDFIDKISKINDTDKKNDENIKNENNKNIKNNNNLLNKEKNENVKNIITENILIEDNKKDEKLKEILINTTLDEQIDSLKQLDNIPKEDIENSANYIVNILNNKEKEEIPPPKLIIHNVFFEWIINNFLKNLNPFNPYNQVITVEYTIDLLKLKIQNFKKNIINYVKDNEKLLQNTIENSDNEELNYSTPYENSDEEIFNKKTSFLRENIKKNYRKRQIYFDEANNINSFAKSNNLSEHLFSDDESKNSYFKNINTENPVKLNNKLRKKQNLMDPSLSSINTNTTRKYNVSSTERTVEKLINNSYSNKILNHIDSNNDDYSEKNSNFYDSYRKDLSYKPPMIIEKIDFINTKNNNDIIFEKTNENFVGTKKSFNNNKPIYNVDYNQKNINQNLPKIIDNRIYNSNVNYNDSSTINDKNNYNNENNENDTFPEFYNQKINQNQNFVEKEKNNTNINNNNEKLLEKKDNKIIYERNDKKINEKIDKNINESNNIKIIEKNDKNINENNNKKTIEKNDKNINENNNIKTIEKNDKNINKNNNKKTIEKNDKNIIKKNDNKDNELINNEGKNKNNTQSDNIIKKTDNQNKSENSNNDKSILNENILSNNKNTKTIDDNNKIQKKENNNLIQNNNNMSNKSDENLSETNKNISNKTKGKNENNKEENIEKIEHNTIDSNSNEGKTINRKNINSHKKNEKSEHNIISNSSEKKAEKRRSSIRRKSDRIDTSNSNNKDISRNKKSDLENIIKNKSSNKRLSLKTKEENKKELNEEENINDNKKQKKTKNKKSKNKSEKEESEDINSSPDNDKNEKIDENYIKEQKKREKEEEEKNEKKQKEEEQRLEYEKRIKEVILKQQKSNLTIKNPMNDYSSQFSKGAIEHKDFLKHLLERNNPNFFNQEKFDNEIIEAIKRKNELENLDEDENENVENNNEDNKNKTNNKYKRRIKLGNNNEKEEKLIYDNSYLLKKKNSNDKFELRKEVLDILSGNYKKNENLEEPKKQTEYKKFIKKRKPLPQILIKGMKNKKKLMNKLKVFNFNLSDEISDETRKKLEMKKREEEEEKLRQINFEEKLKRFFAKIQQLKNETSEKFGEEVDKLFDEQINGSEFGINRKLENRINHFKGSINTYVLQKNNYRKLKQNNLIFKSPCEFETTSKTLDNSF